MIPTIVLVIVILAFVITQVVWDRRRKARFIERFPPISDDEFMALCPPGTSREVALIVRRIISDQLGIEYERIYPSSSFVNDLGV